MANALTLESYFTDRWTKNPVNVVYFDNVVVARRYIGPVGRKGPPQLPARVLPNTPTPRSRMNANLQSRQPTLFRLLPTPVPLPHYP
jgi:hypothetical protein